MPKTPIDYSKAIIYSIVCKTDDTLLYIGSTTGFSKRKNKHKRACINETIEGHNRPVYVMMRANGGWDSFDMKPVKEYPCDNKIQLVIEEERIRKEMNANLNTLRAYTTPEEHKEDKRKYDIIYRKEHKEKICDLKQKQYKEHKEQIAEKSKIYRRENAEHIAEKRKIYEEQNKEHLAKYKKQWWQENKQQILERKIKRDQERKNAL